MHNPCPLMRKRFSKYWGRTCCPCCEQFSVPQIEYPLEGNSKKVVMFTSNTLQITSPQPPDCLPKLSRQPAHIPQRASPHLPDSLHTSSSQPPHIYQIVSLHPPDSLPKPSRQPPHTLNIHLLYPPDNLPTHSRQPPHMWERY